MKKQLAYRIGFGLIMIITGIIFKSLNIGGQEFLGFSNVGDWLIYIGFVSMAIIVIRLFSKKERKVDERMYFVANKANRITFIVVLFASFVIMLIDGIKPITLPLSLFMSYFVCGMIVTYMIAYNVLIKKN